MRWLGFLALVIAVVAVGSPAAAACRVDNLAPQYFVFAESTSGQPVETRVKAFANEFAPQYPRFYAAESFGDAASLERLAHNLLDPATRASIPALASFDEARVFESARAVLEAFTKSEADFVRTFPDFRCEAYIGLGPSMFIFDGHTYRDATGEHLLFGVDAIAAFHSPRTWPAFFDHELFHLEHDQRQGAQPEGNDPWRALWHEGLATYVSQRLNPELPASDVLFIAPEKVAAMERNLPDLKSALLKDIDTPGAYGRWFTGGADRDGHAARAGYFLGYVMARELAKNMSIDQLSRLSPLEVRKRADRFLREG